MSSCLLKPLCSYLGNSKGEGLIVTVDNQHSSCVLYTILYSYNQWIPISARSPFQSGYSSLSSLHTCSKPVAKLYGQNSPVFSLRVDSVSDRVYSIGNDNTVKVHTTCATGGVTCSITMSSLYRFGIFLTTRACSPWYHLYTSFLQQ